MTIIRSEHEGGLRQRKPHLPEAMTEEKAHPALPATPRRQTATGWLPFFRTPINGLRSCLGRPLLPEAATLDIDLTGVMALLTDGTGRGLGELVSRAGQNAMTTEGSSGRSQFPWGLRNKGVIVTQPQDIETLTKSKFLAEYDKTNVFRIGLGGKTRFSLPPDDPYSREQRARLTTHLLAHASLQGHLNTLSDTVTESIDALPHDTPTPLYPFVNSLALDVISRTQLGIEELTPEGKERIADIINRIVLKLTDPSEHIGLWAGSWFPDDAGKIFLSREMKALLEKADVLMQEEIFDNPKNEKARDIIRGKWLNEEEKNEQAPLIKMVKMILMAGHETTTKLLFFTLLILGDTDNRLMLEKIRNEIRACMEIHGHPSSWEISEFYGLQYLKAFLHEVLRLYPPIPDLVFGVEKRLAFAGGILNPGDMVFICPRFTHKLESVYGKDARQFNPERFMENGQFREPPGTCLMSFGKTARRDKLCPGRNFALLEALVMTVLINDKFEFVTSHKANHETDYYQLVTMHVRDDLEQNATLRLIPRHETERGHSLTEGPSMRAMR